MILYTSTDTRQKNAGACSIVVPIYNEENVIPQFHSRLNRVVKLLDIQVHVIYVNDGSHDRSTQIIETLTNLEYDFTLINLSRNFGKEAAMSAGLSKADGDFTIILDVDLQDPPELIPSMINKWKEGTDIVCMQRNKRYGESWFKKISAFLFYKIINRLADCDIPENVGDFRLLDKKVVKELIQLQEKNIYMKGLLAWPGFNQAILSFDRDQRFSGESKWPLQKLLALAMDGITSFSTKPLQIATYLGAAIASGSFFYAVFTVLKTSILGETVTGFPTIIVAITGLGGVQLLSIGLIGAYVGRIYNEVKNRPRFIIASEVNKVAAETSKVISISSSRKEVI